MDKLLSAIAEHGLTNFSDLVGVDAQVVVNWRRRGLPADRVLTVSRATGWRVTPHDLRPDIYPNPTDGLPPDHAAKLKEAA